MKRKIKFFSLIPLLSIGISAPLIAVLLTSCSATKINDEFKDFKIGDKVAIMYWTNTSTGNSSISPSYISGWIKNINTIGIELEIKVYDNAGIMVSKYTNFYPFSNITFIEPIKE